jgi:hypothetical protein
MVCELLTITLNQSDFVAPQSDRSLCMVEGSVRISFFDGSELASLFPVGCTLLDCLRQADLAMLADLKLITGEGTVFFIEVN